MTTNAQRKHLVYAAHYLIDHADLIHYAQVRPMQTDHLTEGRAHQILSAGGHLSMDCSESVTLLFRWAGLRDPNGMNYDGWGNSGSMYAHLKHYENPEDAHPGALVVYGTAGDEHVCMVTERSGSNPWLFSHGSEIGPLHISLDDETRAHAGQDRAFLDISRLGS